MGSGKRVRIRLGQPGEKALIFETNLIRFARRVRQDTTPPHCTGFTWHFSQKYSENDTFV